MDREHESDATCSPVEMRPIYHISNSQGIGWPFDPNFAIHWKGRYHLMWIQGGGRGWAHASSADLIQWRMHPELDLFCLSGNAFLDRNGRPAVIGGGQNSDIAVAVPLDDDLDQWEVISSKTADSPGDPHPYKYDIWDPHCWYDGKEYIAIFGCHPHRGKPASVWRSTGLREWNYVGPLLSHDMPDVDDYEDVSCPDLFKLGNRHILLCIAHTKGSRYYLGEFKDGQFHPERHERMNWPGGACFAPETLLDDQGRRIMWAWAMDTLRYREQEIELGPRGILTMPRTLELVEGGILLIKPVKELEQLRGERKAEYDIHVTPGKDRVLNGITGDCMELCLRAQPGSVGAFGVKVRRSPDGQEETAIMYDPQKNVIRIDLTKSSLDESITYPTYVQSYEGQNGTPILNPAVSAQEAPFQLKPNEELQLRVFLDRSIIEVFINDRLCLTQRIFPTRADSMGVALFCNAGKVCFSSVNAWEMSPIEADNS